MEKSYSFLKTDIEHNLLTLFNITAGSLISIFLLYGYWKGLPTYLLLGRLILIMLLVVTYFIGKKHLQIRKIILIVMSLGMVYLVMSNIHITSSYSLETAFIIGNLLSIMEMSLIVALRNVSQRFFMFIALLAIKVYFLMDESFVYSRKFGVILPIPLIFIMFYIYDQIHDRKMFKAAYGSNDKLKTLQELLFNKDSNLRLTITDLSLENILYSNQTFQTTFHDLSILNKIMLDISPSVLNAGSCYSSLKLETMPEISLATFLQNNILPENTTLNLQGNNPEENPSISYEIRVNKITWDGDFAYALIFTNIISKQGTLDVIKSAEEEKEKMIATVSHELRTPINGILGLIEMVSARTTDSQALIYLDNCRSCSKLLLYLVNSILNLSQFRNNKLAIHKEFLSLERYLEEIRSLYLFSSQQKGINFIIDKDPRVPQKIYTDQYKLTGILVNLLSNAMKFTFKGSVTLKIFPAAKEENNKIVFSVEDTGIGIQENDKAKLFKTFGVLQQKDKSINSQGVGLGLTIAKGLVEALSEDGEVKIEFASEYNKGSKFWFKLNIAGNVSNSPDFKIQEGALNDTTNIFNDTAYLLEQSLHSNRNPEINIRRYTKIKYNNNGINKFGCSGINSACTLTSNSQKKEPLGILIVDDYPLNIIAATFILEKFGYQITKAFSAEEALELLKKSKNESKRFCMIITDIQMPTMDGLQLSRIIREMIFNGEMYGLAIVGLTSKKLTEKDKREYKECGIDISLEKPLNKDEIKNVLQSLNLPFVI